MSDLTEVSELNPTLDYAYSYAHKELKTFSVADSIGKLREKVAPLRFKLAARAITKELSLNGGERVLEVGSGLGLLGKAIKEEMGGDVEYFGLELAFNPASKSTDNLIEPVQASAVNLPFPNEAFDSVVSTDVFEHIPKADIAVEEIYRFLKQGGKAFIVIADPSEARFNYVGDHINRTGEVSDIKYWEKLLEEKGFKMLTENSNKYRNRDWRKIFNLPFLIRFKNKSGFACAFNPVNRPGTYVMEKP